MICDQGSGKERYLKSKANPSPIEGGNNASQVREKLKNLNKYCFSVYNSIISLNLNKFSKKLKQSGNYITDDASLKVFMDHLIKLAVQSVN